MLDENFDGQNLASKCIKNTFILVLLKLCS